MEAVITQKQRQIQTDQESPTKTVLFNLSAGQKGLYILQRLHPEMGAYNVPACLKINGPVDMELLDKAWACVLEQYPILKARIIEKEGELYHQVDEGCKTRIQRQTIDFVDDQELAGFVRKQAKHPFDLNRGPLTRIELFVQDEKKSVLLLTVHHIIFDGSSGIILIQSLFRHYLQLRENRPVRFWHDRPGYQEFVAWEKEMLASPAGAAAADYWGQQLEGELPVLELLSDRRRRAGAPLDSMTLIQDLPEDLCLWIHDCSKAHSLRPSVIFLAVFQLLLHRYTSYEDIIVGMAVNTRTTQKFAAEIGYFVNMVPIRTRCEDRLTFNGLLRRAQATMMDALDHSSYPFPLMLEKLKFKHTQRNPVFQVTYAYHDFVNEASFAPLWRQLALNIKNVKEIVQEGEHDLGLEIFEQEMSFILHLKYNSEFYTEDTARRFNRHYNTLLKAVSKNPDRLLHEYTLISEPERHQLLVDFNASQAEYPKDKCLHELFAEQAALSGDRTAVICGSERLTYQQLYDKSKNLALYLQSVGVRPDSLVGLCLERSLDMIVGLLGILQAGGAYTPLDPGYPDGRLSHMLEDSHAGFVLTQQKLRDKLTNLIKGNTQLIVMDQQEPEINDCIANLKAMGIELQQDVKPHHLAYVMYTSGSTGRPKGVMIEHRSAVNHNVYARKQFQITPQDIQLQFYNSSADAFIEEIFTVLNSGAQMVLEQKEKILTLPCFQDLIKSHRITTLNVPTAFFHELIASNVDLSGIKNVIVGGEELAYLRACTFVGERTTVNLLNTYGPTETTIISAAAPVTASLLGQYDFVPIGVPIANTQIYVLDQRKNIQPIGIPGELYVAGDGLARGYLNRPELTRERFLANPFQPGTRMYKTGDLARWLDGGNLQYLGRADTQVKIRGFRVELGEIEAQLNRYPAIKESAIIAQDHAGSKRLVAFYKTKHTRTDAIPSEELRWHLSRALPEYMIPAMFVRVAAIPLSPNGKVDRQSLAQMDVQTESGREYVAPRNDMEKGLIEIWAQVLNLSPEKIGLNDDFFELGGHSLLATQVIAKIRSQMDVDVPLKALFELSSVAQFAELLLKAKRNQIPPIRQMDRTTLERLPLSFAQERLWFIHQLTPDSPGYNLPGIVTLQGEVDISQLEHAFNMIIVRHENLRTIFPSQEGQAQQFVLERLDFKLERVDLSRYESQEESVRKAKEICQADAATPFDLACGPLLRGKLITLAPHSHILMINMHHIITDGWSLGVMLKELGLVLDALEKSRDPHLAPLPIQYVDYSVWQRTWLEEGGILPQQLRYWQEKLAGVAETLDLPTDFPRPAVQSFAGATHAFTLDAQLTNQLKKVAHQQGCTLYMVLLAAFKALLYRYTGQSDICVGSPIANRQYEETETLIGLFANTLALRTQMAAEDTFSAVLAKVKATCLESYEYQDAPFEKVVDMVRPQRNMAINPIFQVMVILQNADNMTKPDQRIQPCPLHSGISKLDLTADFAETPEGLAGSIEYLTALYKPQTIARMATHFTALCRAISLAPMTRICDLDYIEDSERNQLLVDFNHTQAEYSQDRCLHQLLVEQLTLHAGKTAVVCDGEQLTYQQLYERSQCLALYLQLQGVKPDTLVALCMERSLDMVVALLGILQAGGAYVPLDPAYPEERLAYMLHDSRAAIVLTKDKLEHKLTALAPVDARVIAIDRHWEEISGCVAALKAKGVELQQQVRPHHLAYVVYTSGSTGKPKGVEVIHRSVVNLLCSMQEKPGITEHDTLLAVTTLSFDIAALELYLPLSVGTRLVVVSRGTASDGTRLLAQLRSCGATMLQATPITWRLLLEAGWQGDPKLTILCGGEALPRDLADQLLKTGCPLWNMYGPTETTIWSSISRVEPGNGPVLLGFPISNTQFYIFDQHDKIQPIGVPGELYIAGDGLARGYLNRPELTQEKFVANPFMPGTRMYKTGDLARWLEDGNIEYLGRIDTQVKVRGFRVELGEIETRLNQHPALIDSVVIVQGEQADRRLIAFYRAQGTQPDYPVEVPNEDLRAHLLRSLPEYMLPAAFVSLSAIPLNANGKVDRRALARMDVTIKSGRDYAAPGNIIEEQLLQIWAEVLNLAPEKIGISDSFFELGGHSLSAVRLMAKINSRFEQLLPLAIVFTAPNIAELAKVISSKQAAVVDILVPIQTHGNAPPIFGVPGAGGNVVSLQPLSKALSPDQPFYGLQAVGLDGKALPLNSVEETARVNIAVLKTVQPAGPYNFIGHSYGGVVAYEMTSILASQGEEVSSLVLLDSIAPSIMQAQIANDEAGDLIQACTTMANLYGATLKIDTGRIQRLSGSEDIQYVVDLLNEHGLEITGHQFNTFYRVYRANLLCYRAYRPPMLSGETTVSLYRALHELQDFRMPHDYGWNELLPRPVRVYDVEADHFSILKKVHLPRLNGAGRESHNFALRGAGRPLLRMT